jgi:hypothetical protein
VIPLQEQERLREHFAERLTGGVKIEHFSQRQLSILVAGREECRYCGETRQALQELRALSPKISLRVHELSDARKEAAALGVERAPSTVLRGQLNRPVRFEGFFGAALFPAFVDTLISASRGETELDARTRRRLQRIKTQVSIRMFITPATPFAAPMMQTAFAFGLENQRLKVSIVEVEEFPRLASALQLRAVPTTLIGERARLVGAVGPDVLLDQIIQVSEGHSLTVGDGMLGTPAGPSTSLQPAAQARSTPSGLIIPGR